MKIQARDRFKSIFGNTYTVMSVKKDEIRLISSRGTIRTCPLEEFNNEIAIGLITPEAKLKITRLNVADHLLEYQLNIIGKTVETVKDDDMWFYNNTLTEEQHKAFKAYAIPLLKQVFKFNTKKAETTFSWFDLQFGLRVKN